MKDIDFNDWVAIGTSNGWVSPPFCHTHEGDPYLSKEEHDEIIGGNVVCCNVFKILI